MQASRPVRTEAARSSPTGSPPDAEGIRTPDKPFVVVAIGASAGGLDATRQLIERVPPKSGMAFLLVQHLDPAHPSMLAELLASYTTMLVLEAEEGMPIEPDHLYTIKPGAFLSVAKGALHLTQPQARHGVRLPFDFLLKTVAAQFASRAACVVLSGTGADGSIGLRAIKEQGGLVVAQDPDSAEFDGMPRSATMTGEVDLILPAERIAAALQDFSRKRSAPRVPKAAASRHGINRLAEIIELLRSKTTHDFSLYKPGTLQRRIDRRLGMQDGSIGGIDGYLEKLRADPGELELLAKDLLINVTSFFRDPRVFALLAETILPDLVRSKPAGKPLRIWVAGCSTGEETYTLAMLFQEQIIASGRNVTLQIFASDVDAEAVALAREGYYSDAIASDVSAERLKRFFVKEERGYRVLPALRSLVVFTVQDVLADPPFSRLDFVSCRNLLIYLQPEMQAKVIALFHFALQEDGVLLLGSAETVGTGGGRFEVIAKAERLFRRIGGVRPSELTFAIGSPDPLPSPRLRTGEAVIPSQAFGELCRRLVMEAYAPAAVLINDKHQWLYGLGPTDDYLMVVPGHPNNDVLSMAREGVRTKLRGAIQQAYKENTRVVAGNGHVSRAGQSLNFSVTAQPVPYQGEILMLVSFVEEPPRQEPRRASSADENAQVTELRQQLATTKAELQTAIRNLEISSEEQKIVNEEALSVSEEYQSTNEELLTSKEELQSLNEELTALNAQLQETLERQRTTSDDLQNVLYSTNVATLFLDKDMNIRFFTPATRLLFSVIPTDIGRPLADLSSLAMDENLLGDARQVLKQKSLVEREIEANSGAWYVRRILPYRTASDGVEGVVITFVDISAAKAAALALQAAKRQAELANVAKSRFLAAASHDLRQPLQTLVLLQALLVKAVDGDAPKDLVRRIDETLGAMSGILNGLLDINQIEAGTVHAEFVAFRVTEMFARLEKEFGLHARSGGLKLTVVPSSVWIVSDPRLLEQMLRNLLSNALKYTPKGKVLLGCRHRPEGLSIEIWDTGVGIPTEELGQIFDEYHQVDSTVGARNGLGLGLAIVKRLGGLLGHQVRVRSQVGRGSVFSIEVGAQPARQKELGSSTRVPFDTTEQPRNVVSILIVEDDTELRELLEISLRREGHRIAAAGSGTVAVALVAAGNFRPDLILSDYNLPGGPNGLQTVATLRQLLGTMVPAIMLTGDIATEALRQIAEQNCVHLNKPVTLVELGEAIQFTLQLHPEVAKPQPSPTALAAPDRPSVILIEDDLPLRQALRDLFEQDGWNVRDYGSSEALLEGYRTGLEACLIVDAHLPGMSGLELLQRLHGADHGIPAIMITGDGDVPMAVAAMKAGAVDFMEKPIRGEELLKGARRLLDRFQAGDKRPAGLEAGGASPLSSLTARQRQIMDLVLAGQPSKNIAADLGISQRTVENHRAAIMKKTGAKSLPGLVRLAVSASWREAIVSPLDTP